MDGDVVGWIWFVVGLGVLVALTLALSAGARIGLGLAPLRAILRAALQLAVVALILRGVLAAPATVIAFVALMLATAGWTAGGRLRDLWHGRRAALGGVVAGAAVSVGAILALRLVDLDARELVAIGGIVIGSSMSTATLSGRNLLRAARTRAGEIEAWLALGATPSQAHAEIGREAVRESLLPNLDQTRSTGLVTLPGAFVGALFGGASPVEAARFQLVVLAGIALASTIAALVVTRTAGRTPYVADPQPG